MQWQDGNFCGIRTCDVSMTQDMASCRWLGWRGWTALQRHLKVRVCQQWGSEHGQPLNEAWANIRRESWNGEAGSLQQPHWSLNTRSKGGFISLYGAILREPCFEEQRTSLSSPMQKFESWGRESLVNRQTAVLTGYFGLRTRLLWIEPNLPLSLW
jgi:hypothetical protein